MRIGSIVKSRPLESSYRKKVSICGVERFSSKKGSNLDFEENEEDENGFGRAPNATFCEHNGGEYFHMPRARRHPEWIRARAPAGRKTMETADIVARHGLHTVCKEARCPNLGECWAHSTATFLLLGDLCTRECRFCAVSRGRPAPVDPDEPARIARAAEELGLRHVVLTSVTRDDLTDGGSGQFAATASEIRRACPDATIEVLVPDFQGCAEDIERILAAPIDVFNHNVETVPRLYPSVRLGADYRRSIAVLARGAERCGVRVKTGLMLGLGEEPFEVRSVMDELRRVDCDILTLGQYLQPTSRHLPVVHYLPPEAFAEYRDLGLRMGFRCVESGPLVRSSYHAWKHVE